MTGSLDRRYDAIWRYEKGWAAAIAAAIHQKRPFTVWEVMLPVFLIFNWARKQVDQDIFCRNMLLTKKMALDLAKAMLEKGISKDEALQGADQQTRAILDTARPDVYSETVRSRQLEEVGFLVDHYRNLLALDGDDFGGLVRRVYGSRDAYLDFVTALGAIEHGVNQAALETVGDRGDPLFIEKMEDASRRYRVEAAGRLFSG